MEYKKLEAARLKQLCEDRKLDSKGNKDTLMKRLKDWDFRNEPQLELGDNLEKEAISNARSKGSSKRLFIQVKVSNISHYFNAGLIYPIVLEESEIYVRENRKHDIFTQFQQHIVLGSGPINEFGDDDALLDITTDHLDISEISGTSLFRCDKPIPLSRVKAIVFKTDQSKTGFISSAKTFPDFFVEEKMCYVSSSLKPINVNLEAVTLEPNQGIDKWHDIMDRFDKVMGMFAFMKNAGVFFADREGLFEEYTTNYFSALSVVNPVVNAKVTRDIALYKYIIFPGEIETTTVQRLLFQKILKAIYDNIEMDLSFAQKILHAAIESGLANSTEKHELLEISSLFERLQGKQISYKDVVTQTIVQRNYPVLALLFLSRFSNKSRQHTDKQAVRNNFLENNSPLSKSASEFLMAVLGLYYGYKTMIKEDTNVNLIDPFFSSLSRRHQSIKFRITSYLDRFVIESSYWFAINGTNKANSYNYLEYNTNEHRDTLTVSSGAYEYIDQSYPYHTSTVNVYRRVNKLDKIFESLDRIYPNQISANSALVQNLVTNYGLKKIHLFELMRENISKMDLNSLEHLIEFDKKQKFKK